MKRGAGSTEVRERSEEGFVGLAGALELGPIASDRIKHFIDADIFHFLTKFPFGMTCKEALTNLS